MRHRWVTALGAVWMCVRAFAVDTTPAPLDAEKPPWGDDPKPAAAYARVAAIAELGREFFFDPRLSSSGAQSCASCHSPATAFGPPNALAVQRGGPHLRQAGTRAAPSLTYMTTVPSFTEHFYESDEEGDESVDQGPAGGRTWDGRVDRMRDQARIPLLSANEMANVSEAAVVARVKASPEAGRMRELFGGEVFANTHDAFDRIGEALETFEESPALFSPYTSKYDAFLRGQTALSAQELRGLAVFNAPDKGNCVRCHRSQLTPNRLLPKFTDFGFVAVGAPRNRAIPANADVRYFDLGACGPLRKDLARRSEYCGMFRAPTLRNVAMRKVFFHNGVFHELRDAVAFYATRDTNPERWYPRRPDGTIDKFDDLPEQYRSNVDVEPPFDRKAGDVPAMSESEIDDVVAFLGTLTDGWSAEKEKPPSISRRGF